MFRTNLFKSLSLMLLAGASLLVAAACGATPGGGAPAGQAPLPNPASAPAAAPAPNAPAVSTGPGQASNPGPAPQGGGQGSSDLLAKGKLVYEKTAGGVGCAYCHGMDGKGAGPSGLNAPPIQGKTEAHVRDALANMVMMSFVKLSDDEITAVGAYLQYLGQQP